MMNRFSFNILLLFAIAVAVVVTEAFQNSRGDVQSLSHACKWRLAAIDNNDKRNLTPAQRALQQTIRKEKSISEFDQFKRTVYSGVDSIQSLAKGKAATESKVIDGYSERTATVLGKANPSTTMSLFAIKEKTSVSREVSPFDQVKSVLYETLDFAGKVMTNKWDESETPQKRVDSLPVISVAEANSKGNLLSSQVLAELEPRLRSGNVVIRLIAQVELTQLEGKERIRLQRLEAQKKLQEVKEFVYSVVDGIKSFVDFVLTVPGKSKKAAASTVRFAASIPDTVEEAVETVQSIPNKAKETVDELQSKVENTVSTTKQFVADVRDLPNTVQRKADETKQTITKVIETVNDGATSVKVLVGLEKPKPKPPSTPPPTPPKAGDVALKFAGFVLKTTGKATWWLGKTVGSAAYNAAVSSLDKSDNQKQMASVQANRGDVLDSRKEMKVKQQSQVKTAAQAARFTPPKPNPPPLSVAKTKPMPPPSLPKAQRDTSGDIQNAPPKAPPYPPKQDVSENVEKKSSSTRLDLSALDEEVRNALQQAAEALEGAERFKAKRERKKKSKLFSVEESF